MPQTEPEPFVHRHPLRVRYGETDQMGTFYNARALDWFEVGRSELSRALGFPYTEWEKRGAFLPLVEAHVRYRARAQYDDLLEVATSGHLAGGAKVRFECVIRHAPEGPICCEGYTIHAIVDREGRVIRPPEWVRDAFAGRWREEPTG